MPELPEVECIRLGLAPAIGRGVVAATLHRRDVAVAPGDPAGGFSRQRGDRPRPRRVTSAMLLAGSVLGSAQRRGKQLALIGGGGGPVVVVQLGMSGQVIHRAAGQRLADAAHVHATWRLDDGSRIVFRDPRRFGGLRLLPDREALLAWWDQELGPDALTIGAPALAAGLAGSARAVKAALLDQRVLAGVGNIYADEAMHRAGVHPARAAGSLTAAEVRSLAAAVRGVLREAVQAGGSTLRDYVDARGNPGSYRAAHRVYGRSGEPCLTCGATLASGVLGQRTTVWCPRCQASVGPGPSLKR